MTTTGWTKKIIIDDRLESYRGFFSDNWCHRIDALIHSDSQLRSLVWDLIAEWRGTAYTASFPAQLVEHLRTFAEGYVNGSGSDITVIQFADVALTRLAGEIPELRLDQQLQLRLYERVVRLAAEIRDARQAVHIEFPSQDLWCDYLSHHVYKVTIWSTLRLCYVAVFNAYDNFVGRCLTVARHGKLMRTTSEAFSREFAKVFGPSVLQKCWSGADVQTVRLVRHALSHASGRETPELKQNGHQLRVEQNEIHILPDDLKALYVTLKRAAFTLAESANPMPQFK